MGEVVVAVELACECGAVARADSAEALADLVAAHARDVHHLELPRTTARHLADLAMRSAGRANERRQEADRGDDDR
jgi:predicted small metal-binding protein